MLTVIKPMAVSMLTPLELPVGKEVLIAVLEDVLENIQTNRSFVSAGPEDDLELDLMVEQRKQFLMWVQDQPGPNVAIAMYPLESPTVMVQYGTGPQMVS